MINNFKRRAELTGQQQMMCRLGSCLKHSFPVSQSVLELRHESLTPNWQPPRETEVDFSRVTRSTERRTPRGRSCACERINHRNRFADRWQENACFRSAVLWNSYLLAFESLFGTRGITLQKSVPIVRRWRRT